MERYIIKNVNPSIHHSIFSFDAELHLVHYKSTYDNISAAVADGQNDSLAVVGIFMREATKWHQWKGEKGIGLHQQLEDRGGRSFSKLEGTSSAFSAGRD